MSTPSADELKAALLARLSLPVRDAIGRVAANGKGWSVYLVAGALRDLLLDRTIHDLDLVVEGDAMELADDVLADVRRTEHVRFRTATVRIDRIRVDLATARTETYSRPGALPVVTPAKISEDLRRRDFSINAMALRLSGEPMFLDPHDGAADLRARRVRVLYEASFQDDATRMFRALRYAARLGFSLDAQTRELLDRDVAFVETIGGERLRRELDLMLGETTAGMALQSAHDAGLLQAVHPALAWSSDRTAALDGPGPGSGRRPIGFALLAWDSRAAPDAVVVRLRLKRDEAAAVRGLAALRDAAQILRRREVKPSGVVLLLERFPAASVAAFAALSEDSIAAALALRYLDEWRHIRPELRGDDLAAMGVPIGPQIQRGLQLIRAARLDGTARDLADERILALRFVKSIRDANTMTASIDLHTNGN